MPMTILGTPAFSVKEADVKRAGLDHWSNLDFELITRFKEFYKTYKHNSPWIAVTKDGESSLWKTKLPTNPVFLFGSETKGLPPSLRKQCSIQLRIPVYGPVRSFNLANSVAVVLSEYLRQNPKKSEINPRVKTYRRPSHVK